MQHGWKLLLHRLTYAVTLVIFFLLAQKGGHAQSFAVSPGFVNLVAGNPGNPGGTATLSIPSPATYVGPAAGLVPYPYYWDAKTDQYGNVYVSEYQGNIVRVIASGNGPIPALPSVTSPQAGYAYTVAGTGVTDTSGTVAVNPVGSSCTGTDAYGDGCPATQAVFGAGDGFVYGIAVDANGNLYIADHDANVLRVVYGGKGTIPGISNPQQGYIYTIAGSYGVNTDTGDNNAATSATVGGPWYVALDSNGNIYFVDQHNNVLRAISVSGTGLPGNETPTIGYIYTIVGNTGSTASGVQLSSFKFKTPYGIAVDSSGNIYVADNGAGVVEVIYVAGSVPGLSNLTPGTVYYFTSGPGPLYTAKFFTPNPASGVRVFPTEVAIDSVGDILIAANYLYKVDLAGNLTEIYGYASDATYKCATPVDEYDDGCAADANTTGGGLLAITQDPLGNLYVPDNEGLLHEMNPTTSSLFFKSGQTQPVIIYNTSDSTTPLTLTSFTVSSSFTVVPLSTVPTGFTADCSTLPTLQPGESCESEIEFPSSDTTGATGTLTIGSNSTNATNGANIIQLTGQNSSVCNANPTLENFRGFPTSITALTPESFEYQLACAETVGGTTYYPTGTLTLYSNGTPVPGVTPLTVDNTTATQTYTFSNVLLPTGSDLIYAVYSGDTYDAPGTSSQALIDVTGTASSTTLTASPTTAATNQTVTLTANVSPSSATGTVTFKSGSTTLGTSQLGASGTPGVATLTTSFTSAGTDSITAVYSGDTTYDTSTTTSPATVTVVQQISTTTTLASSVNSVGAGGSVLLTATVAPISGTTVPTGTVNFYDGGTQIGSGTLSAGSVSPNALATYTVALSAEGSQQITASYLGVPLFSPSNSQAVTITVGAPATTTTWTTAPPSSITYGQSVSMTVTVQTLAGTPVTSGTVSFAAGTTALGTAQLNANGQVTLSTTALPGGSGTVIDSVTATYQGSTNFSSSTTTSAASVSVSPVSTTTTLGASSLNPSYGQNVTLTATVAPTSGSMTPTGGSVTFYNGTSTLGTEPVNSGVATLIVSTLPVGTDPITATYAGGNGFTGSTSSPALSLSVSSAPSTTTTQLAASLSSLYVGQPVTFTATVTTTGSGTPTGYVTFQSTSGVLGSGSLNGNGVATLTTSSLPAGAYSVQAIYQGNTGYSASNSNTVSVAVSQSLGISSTTLALSSSAVQEGQNVTFTATVGPASPVTPTGNVTFMSGNTQLGQGTLYGGTATYSTTALAPGNYSVTAVYPGDPNFAGSTSNAVALTVAAPTPSFTLSATPTNITLQSGQTAAAIITLVPTYGYAGTVTLSCGTLPKNVTCSFSPATLTADGNNDAVQSTLTITTNGQPAPSSTSSARVNGAGGNGSIKLAAFFFLPSGLLVWGFAARRKQLGRYLPLLVLTLLTVGMAGLSSCGGGNGGSSQNAPAGTSQIVVNAVGSTGSQTQTVNLSITVTQ